METCCWVGGCFRREVLCVRAWVGGRSNFARTEHLRVGAGCGAGQASKASTRFNHLVSMDHGAAACPGVSVSVRGVAFACCASVLSENFLLCCIFPTHTNDTRINQVPTMSSLAGRRLRAPQRVMPPCSCVALSLSGSPRPVVVSSRSSWRCSALLTLVPHHWIRQRRTGRTMHPGSRLPWEEKTAGPLI